MKKRFYHSAKQVTGFIALIAALLFSGQAFSQGVVISNSTSDTPDPSAVLDLSYITNKGFLTPRVALTGAGDLMGNLTLKEGLIVYHTGGGIGAAGFYYNASTTPGSPNWVSISAGGGSAPTAGKDIDVAVTTVDIEPILNWVHTINPTDGGGASTPSSLTVFGSTGNDLILGANATEVARIISGGKFGVGDASPASLFTVGSGDKFQVDANGNMIVINNLSGYSWPTSHVAGVLRNNGSGTLTWGPPTISGTAPLTNNNVWIGVGGVATERTMSGDGTFLDNGSNAVLDLSNLAVETSEINTNAVTDAKLRQSAGLSVIGRSASSTGDVADIVGTSDQVLRVNSAGSALGFGQINLASSSAVTGILPIVNGGTGLSSLGSWSVFYTNGSGVLVPVALSATTNQVLASTGATSAPTWISPLVNPMNSLGDMIYGLAGGAPAELASGTGVLHGNGAAAPTWAPVNMAGGATEVSGILPVGNGGTGVSTIATNGIVVGNGTSAVNTLTGTNMQTIRNASGVWTANDNILDNGTKVGIGGLTTAEVTASTAKLDVDGDATSALSLQLRSGNNAGGSGGTQIAFGHNGNADYRHSIKTRHQSSTDLGNAIDFYIWTNTAESGVAGTLGSRRVAILDGLGGFSLLEGGASPTNYTRIVAGTQAADLTLTLPIDAGTNNYVLKTNGTGTLAWVDPATLLATTTNTLVNNGTNTMTSTVNGISDNDPIINTTALSQNGSNQLTSTVNGVNSTAFTVAIAGDVTGNLGASTVARIRGTNVNITALGTGNILQYNGTDWVNTTVAGTNADLTVQNGLYLSTGTTYDGSTATTIKQGGALTENTAITQGSFTYTLGGNTINLNAGTGAATATNIGTGTTTGTVTIGGSAAQSIAIGDNATGAKTITIGSGAVANTITVGNVTGTTVVNIKGGTGASTFETTGAGTLVLGGAASTGAITVGSSSGAQTVNVGTGAGVSTVNVATGASGNLVNINNGAAAGLVQIGRSNMLNVDLNGVGVGVAPSASYKFIVSGKVKSTGINETSDARLKKNFASIDGALSKVLAMNGKYYDWKITEFPDKGLEEGRQVGVIAQEMEKILPEVVTTGDDGFKAVEYGHIVPVLIEAIKEQQKIIDGQKSTIDELKASLENVINRMNIIENNTDINSSKVEK